MNFWLVCAAILLLAMVPSGWVCLRGPSPFERLVALQMIQILAVLTLLLLAQGYDRDMYFDVGLIMAVLSLASGLVYARFLERWL